MRIPLVLWLIVSTLILLAASAPIPVPAPSPGWWPPRWWPWGKKNGRETADYRNLSSAERSRLAASELSGNANYPYGANGKQRGYRIGDVKSYEGQRTYAKGTDYDDWAYDIPEPKYHTGKYAPEKWEQDIVVTERPMPKKQAGGLGGGRKGKKQAQQERERQQKELMGQHDYQHTKGRNFKPGGGKKGRWRR